MISNRFAEAYLFTSFESACNQLPIRALDSLDNGQT